MKVSVFAGPDRHQWYRMEACDRRSRLDRNHRNHRETLLRVSLDSSMFPFDPFSASAEAIREGSIVDVDGFTRLCSRMQGPR